MKLFSVSLRSGSSGNSTFVRTESAGIAIDCGLNGRQFAMALQSIGESPSDLDALLLTHEHTDHCSGLGVVLRRHHIPLFLTEKTYKAVKADLGRVADSLIHLIQPGEPFAIKETVVTPFSTPHDAVDSIGFRIETGCGDIGIATDLGYFSETVRESLTGCRVVHLESNYDPHMLETGSYPRFLKKRIAGPSGHLSNEEAALAASWLIRHGAEAIVLSHLSQENNLPDLALRVVTDYLGHEGAKAGRDYVVHVSPRYACSRPVFFDDPFVCVASSACVHSAGEQLSLFARERAAGEEGAF
ncbi:MAG: MBL fold metallo-hydrolase [Clostridiaceae bacterium]|nr:MBL fold metallo-hydrolase [Clostridiaceae bacterium]